MITQKTINDIFETAKVEEVVGEFVTLRKRGVNLIGLCPFHNEKTPSFTVSPAKNIYKCFGCGEAGNAVNFLMEHNQMTYPEALRYLAEKYSIEVEETRTSQEGEEERQLFQSLYLINEFAQQYFQQQLFETDRGRSVGLAYFKDRGFREETIKKFGLGYAPAQGDALTKKALKEGYKMELLQKAGVSTANGRDFFRDRVQFVIHNVSGKVVGFGGRILNTQIKGPKYINTAESEIYSKSKTLYGAYQARKAIRKNDECLMVEGYTDVISLHQAGIEHVVASSGTALTVDQIRLVKRYTQNLTILYDGDPAGIKAALRGLDLVLEQDMNVKIVLLPDGEDPDSYLQRVGVARFKDYIKAEAADFILFKTRLLLEEAQGDPAKKAALIQDIISTIALIHDPIKRSVYIRECADRMEINEQILVDAVNKKVRSELSNREQKKLTSTFSEIGDSGKESTADSTLIKKENRVLNDDFQEKDLIRLLVEFGDRDLNDGVSVGHYIMANMEDIMNEFDNQFYKEVILACFDRIRSKLIINRDFFLNHEKKEISELAINLISSPHEYSINWEERLGHPLQTQLAPDKNFKKDVELGVDRFKFKKVDRLCKKNLDKMKSLNASGDAAALEKAMKVHKKLLEFRKTLGEKIGTVGAI